MRFVLLLVLYCSLAAAETKPWDSGSIYPAWSKIKPIKVLAHHYNKSKSPEQNGLALAQTIDRLKPGEQLLIERGTYSVNKHWSLLHKGDAKRPIWIAAAPKHHVIVTRPNIKDNLISVGGHSDKEKAQFICIRGIEFKGGSTVMRLHRVSHIWIDRCHLHHGNNVGITVNSQNADHVYITHNKIHDPGPKTATAEGMYIGSNNGKTVVHSSVIAFNEVFNCHGTQGDGIEVKQGSYDNWIVGNKIYDCNYPCIIAYGSKGKGTNLIENNVCFNSNDNAIQVQGDAIVRNNLAINARLAAFKSIDHQGSVDNIHVYNNTFINKGKATHLNNWNNKKNVLFANNACYSLSDEAIRIHGGHAKALIGSNIVFGKINGLSSGYKMSKNGLKDFIGLSADGKNRDARPSSSSSLLGNGDSSVANPFDLYRLPRSKKSAHVGAVMPRKSGVRTTLAKLNKSKVKADKKDTADWQREEPGRDWQMEEQRVKKEKVWVLLPPAVNAK